MHLSFSALQRAENSSISSLARSRRAKGAVSVLFSEPKIPQFRDVIRMLKYFSSFSALQRAENSSISTVGKSARSDTPSFSALQRAENSSIGFYFKSLRRRVQVSVLFSEPKIPQFSVNPQRLDANLTFQCSSASRKFLNWCGIWTI